MLLLALLASQITLGAYTVLTAKHYIINSLHVVNGALVLVTSLVLTLRAHRSRFAHVARAFLPDGLSDEAPRAESEARRAESGEIRDATKEYGGVRA
jgi:sirohydrochlorin ferrochelatase